MLTIDQSGANSLHLVWTRVSSGVGGLAYTPVPSNSPVAKPVADSNSPTESNGLAASLVKFAIVNSDSLAWVYYYNGRRKFQGPMLRGGPTIVRVTHPYTNSPVKVSFALPSGSPQVKVGGALRRCVEFRYGKHHTEIWFYRDGRVNVKY